MAKKKINVKKIRGNYLFAFCVLCLFILFIARLTYLCVVDYNVGSETISSFIKKRNNEEDIIYPVRGSIKDSHGNVLAQDVASYTVIAYLDSSRSENSKKPMHVVDVDATAKILAPYLDMDVSVLRTLLSKKAYQVELGPGGRNLSQIKMEEIKNLNLPGIDFTSTTKRYYPNGNFASYAVGYTVNKNKDDNVVEVGQLGVEEYFNETLTGFSGYITYEKDRNGYKIANGREYKEDADDGDDVYLTIDSNIQLFTESAVKKMEEDSKAEWAFSVVADAKSGAILSYATYPSFDPNKKDIVNYIDPLTGYVYEPGSTMKTFSYMCAIDNGKYDGSATFNSGLIKYVASDGTETVIHDWNKTGWGNISYDYGFAMSSNVGAASLLENKIIEKKTLSDCYSKFGFGKITNFTVNREAKGSIKFNYDIDAASATFGQGITITPIQMVEALTAISNDGKMVKPYLIKKIVDTNNGESLYDADVEVVDTVVNSATVEKIKDLMASVVCNDSSKCTGSAYYMDGYPIIGKTGTAQIYDEKTGTYMKGESDYIYSFAGLYPKDDPKIIVYSAVKKPKDTTNYVANNIKSIIVNASKYLNIVIDDTKSTTYSVPNFINKDVDNISSDFKKNMNVFVLGTGKKVINQYPIGNCNLYKGSVVALLTDTYDKKMPNLVGLSYKDASNILKLMGVRYELDGSGYVKSQNVKEGDIVTDNVTVLLKLDKDI